MIVIPAIDIIGGKAVRLYQGDYRKKEVVGNDILDIAKGWSTIYSLGRFRWCKKRKVSK